MSFFRYNSLKHGSTMEEALRAMRLSKKVDVKSTSKVLRDRLPVYTRTQIRRYRLPHHEAVMEELYEKHLYNAAEFIRQLLEYQENYRREYSYDIIVQSKPQLIHSDDELTYLYKGLEAAELAHMEMDISREVDEMLRLAVHFGTGNTNWLWLAEQIFAQALKISNDYDLDKGFKKALSCYVYGKYLLEQNIDVDKCVDFLNIARELSKGTDWSAYKLFQTPQKPLFVEACTLLYGIYTKLVNIALEHNPKEALELCKVARERALDACLPRADIIYLNGRCEMEVNNPVKAAESFNKAFLIYKAEKNIEKSCQARISLALAYLDAGNWEKANEELERLLQFAVKNNLEKFEGLAHLYRGQFYLNRGMADKATPVLYNALEIFHRLNDVSHREFVSNLAAVSSGQEIIADYIVAILKCEHENEEKKAKYLLNLVAWKDSREPFWEDISESTKTELSGESVEEETIEEEMHESEQRGLEEEQSFVSINSVEM